MTTAAVAPVLASLRMLARAGRTAGAGSGARYATFADLILSEGRLFLPAPAGDDDPVLAPWRAASGDCYRAAAHWAGGGEMVYVEGWAAATVAAVGLEHAWCARPGDPYAYDPSWAPGFATGYIGLPVHPGWRAQIPHPHLLTVAHPIGRALLRDGLPPQARVETGLPLPDLSIPL